jgi:hypothetical protein
LNLSKKLLKSVSRLSVWNLLNQDAEICFWQSPKWIQTIFFKKTIWSL